MMNFASALSHRTHNLKLQLLRKDIWKIGSLKSRDNERQEPDKEVLSNCLKNNKNGG